MFDSKPDMDRIPTCNISGRLADEPLLQEGALLCQCSNLQHEISQMMLQALGWWFGWVGLWGMILGHLLSTMGGWGYVVFSKTFYFHP